MKWLIGVGIFSIVGLGLMLMIKKHRGRSMNVLSELAMDARQIGLALDAFDRVYGRYPDSSTIAPVLKASGSRLTLGNGSSNAIFRQLMVTGIATDETIFSADTGPSTQPDNIFKTDATMLANGECAFAYLPGFDSTCDWNTPLAFGPVIPGTTTLDSRTFGGKAVVLKRDMSVIAYPVTKAGKLMYGGMDLLDPRQPYWQGKPPDVKWPK